MRRLFLAPLFLAVVACSKASAPPPDRTEPPAESPAIGGPVQGGRGGVERAAVAPVQPLQKTKFGDVITEKISTPLPTLISSAPSFGNKTVRTEGTVTAVCQSMGCWMEIGDETGTAHIKMAGHKFFVPKEASGHRAVVQGKLVASEEGGACSGKDGCREKAEKETGRVAKIELEATGVEFTD